MKFNLSVPRISVQEAFQKAVLSREAKLFDVRSSEEFEVDSLPGSENLPVLDNEERKVVGTLYKNDQQQARQVGASMISQHLSKHLQRNWSESPGKNIIYCAKGGMRSQSLCSLLNLIGVDSCIVDGGYKSYRNFIDLELKSVPNKRFRFHVLSGLTGTKKTKALHRLQSIGHQVLDIEGLAKHRGSVLGAFPFEQQPTQKHFETLLVAHLLQMDPQRAVWVEAESIRVGNLFFPKILWDTIMTGKENAVFDLKADVDDRVDFLLEDYAHWQSPGADELLTQMLSGLEHSVDNKKLIQQWVSLVQLKDFRGLVHSLLVNHYDKRYPHNASTKLLSQHANRTETNFDKLVDTWGEVK